MVFPDTTCTSGFPETAVGIDRAHPPIALRAHGAPLSPAPHIAALSSLARVCIITSDTIAAILVLQSLSVTVNKFLELQTTLPERIPVIFAILVVEFQFVQLLLQLRDNFLKTLHFLLMLVHLLLIALDYCFIVFYLVFVFEAHARMLIEKLIITQLKLFDLGLQTSQLFITISFQTIDLFFKLCAHPINLLFLVVFLELLLSFGSIFDLTQGFLMVFFYFS